MVGGSCKFVFASMFYKVVHWQKLGEEENEDILHNFIILAIFVPKIIKFSWNLTKLWQKQFWLVFFLWDTVYNTHSQAKLTINQSNEVSMFQHSLQCIMPRYIHIKL